MMVVIEIPLDLNDANDNKDVLAMFRVMIDGHDFLILLMMYSWIAGL